MADRQRFHPDSPVAAHGSRVLCREELEGFQLPRRYCDGPPRTEHQASRMEEDSGIDSELRGLQFG